MSAPVVTTVLSVEEAKTITSRLQEVTSEGWELIGEAYQGRVWLALGYRSWDAYLDGELGGIRLPLPREEARTIIESLQTQGMTLAAIASAAVESRATVHRRATQPIEATAVEVKPERRQLSHAETTDRTQVQPVFKESTKRLTPERVTGRDGKSYPTTKAKPEVKPEPRVDPFAVDRYRAVFHKDMARLMGIVNAYDVERLADIATPEMWECVDSVESVIGSFVRRVREKKPAALRVVGEKA